MPRSSDLRYACTQSEKWLLPLHITLTAPNTPQWGSPPRSTSTSWGVGPPALPPHSHPLWVLSASPTPVPRESAWEGAVEPRCHTGVLFPLHALRYKYFTLIFFWFSSKFQRCLCNSLLSLNPTVIFLCSTTPSAQWGCWTHTLHHLLSHFCLTCWCFPDHLTWETGPMWSGSCLMS